MLSITAIPTAQATTHPQLYHSKNLLQNIAGIARI